MALKKIESELASQSQVYEQLLSDYDEKFESQNFNKKLMFLKNENKQIRQELKRFNELINDLVVSHKKSIIYLLQFLSVTIKIKVS